MQSLRQKENHASAAWPLLMGLCVLGVGCERSQPSQTSSTSSTSNIGIGRTAVSPVSADRQMVARIERFCGDCHPFPEPATFPRDHWEEEVLQGYDFYIASKRTDLDEPPRQDTVRFYTEMAPEKVEVPRADKRPVHPAPLRFELAQQPIAPVTKTSSIAHVIQSGNERVLFSADMRQGGVDRWSWDAAGAFTSQRIGNVSHACRLTPCDWDQDGIQDILVGDIGSYGVGDHSSGAVVALLNRNGAYEKVVLAERQARVVECQPIDYEGDGDLDVLVAEFGWLETGALKLLRNETTTDGKSKLNVEILDPRHGALGVRVLDLNQDGHQDYVVAWGQEYESVEVWYGEGAGKYRHQILLELPDPSYNSSFFEMVDIDQDGLVDILHTNGDTLDAFLPKPYHGVRWIRNLGNGAWENHELGLLVGALQAAACDLDLDGDLDVVGVGMFPFAGQEPGAYDSICWWEQQPGLQFTQHTIERDRCDYASFITTDVNGDGRPDLVLGNWTAGPQEEPLRVYLNFANEQ